ncbi:MAG: hypothetical protein R2991_12170 [Thermoanaerobaculia bacterium]
MPETLARVVVGCLYAYLALGLAVAIGFVARGLARIDARGTGATWGFRLLVLPGCTLLWPLVLKRWLRGGPPEERNAHRVASARSTS